MTSHKDQKPLNYSEFLKVAAHLKIGLSKIGLDGSWLWVNSHLCELLEFTESEMLSMTIHEIMHHDDLSYNTQMLEYLEARKETQYTMIKRYYSKRGKIVWFKTVVIPIFEMTEHGEVLRYFISQLIPIDGPNTLTKSPESDMVFERIDKLLSLNQEIQDTDDLKMGRFFHKHWLLLLGLFCGAIVLSCILYGEYLRLSHSTNKSNSQVPAIGPILPEKRITENDLVRKE